MRTLAIRSAAAAIAAAAFLIVACEQMATPPDPEPAPDPPATEHGPLTPQEAVKVVEEGSAIAAVASDSMTFTTPVAYAMGDVLIVGVTEKTPHGLLRKVTAVSGDKLTVTTEPATLEDVIEDGTLSVSGELLPADITPASRAAIADAGIVLQTGLTPATSDPYSITLDFPAVAFEKNEHTIVLDGSASFSMSYDLEADYRDSTLHSARFGVLLLQRSNLQLSYVQSAPTDEIIRGRRLETGLFVKPLRFGPFPVPGTIPLLIFVELQVYIGIDGTGQVTVHVQNAQSATAGVSCADACDMSSNWDGFGTSDSRFELTRAAVGAEITGYLKPQVSFQVYDTAGPTLAVEGFVVAGGKLGIRPDDGRFVESYVDVGVSGEAALVVEVPVLGWTLKRVSIASWPIVKRYRLWGSVSFEDRGVDHQTYTTGNEIDPLELPEAIGGLGELTYRLTPTVPGLTFDTATRKLTGTPTTAGTYELQYEASDDANDDRVVLPFTITVTESIRYEGILLPIPTDVGCVEDGFEGPTIPLNGGPNVISGWTVGELWLVFPYCSDPYNSRGLAPGGPERVVLALWRFRGPEGDFRDQSSNFRVTFVDSDFAHVVDLYSDGHGVYGPWNKVISFTKASSIRHYYFEWYD